MAKLHVKRGDTVAVLTGDDKGKRGKVLKVFPRLPELSSTALIYRRSTPDQPRPIAGASSEARAHQCFNVALVCPAAKLPQDRAAVSGRKAAASVQEMRQSNQLSTVFSCMKRGVLLPRMRRNTKLKWYPHSWSVWLQEHHGGTRLKIVLNIGVGEATQDPRPWKRRCDLKHLRPEACDHLCEEIRCRL